MRIGNFYGYKFSNIVVPKRQESLTLSSQEYNNFELPNFYYISFSAKKPSNPDIEKFKQMEIQAKKQRENLPVFLQVMYPLVSYPRVKGNEIRQANQKILEDITLPSELKGCLQNFLLNGGVDAAETLKTIETEILNNQENTNNIHNALIDNTLKKYSVLSKKNTLEKISFLKTIRELNVDGSILEKRLIPEYNSLLEYAKDNKELLTEPVQDVMTDEEIDAYFDKNAINILRTLCVLDANALKLRMSQRLKKFNRTIEAVNNLVENKKISPNLIKVFGSCDTDRDSVKMAELLNGLLKFNISSDKINEYIDFISNSKVDKVLFLSDKYIENLYAINNLPLKGMQDFDKNYVYTIPSFIDEGSEWHKQQFLKLISTSNDSSYRELIQDSQNSYAVANKKTKAIFEQENLDYNEWLNYSKESNIEFLNKRLNQQLNKTKYHSSVKPLEKLSFRCWKRIPQKDIFQGSSAVQCIALDGINKNAAIDELLYTYAQLVELYNNTTNKSVGNACTYWIKDENNQKALLIDSVSVHPDYENNYPIRQQLFKYVKEYAKAVAGEDMPVYIGNQFNKFLINDLPVCEKTKFSILGDTDGNDVYLDAIIAKGASERYVPFDENKKFVMDLRVVS